jgi:hypothetical protein
MASWQNGAYPKPEPDIWANAFTFGVTRPAPLGVQKFTWNTKTRSFEKNWINNEIDNTDVMVPVISAASRMIYLAHKQNGVYEYVGVDWDTGEIKARWPSNACIWATGSRCRGGRPERPPQVSCIRDNLSDDRVNMFALPTLPQSR